MRTLVTEDKRYTGVVGIWEVGCGAASVKLKGGVFNGAGDAVDCPRDVEPTARKTASAKEDEGAVSFMIV